MNRYEYTFTFEVFADNEREANEEIEVIYERCPGLAIIEEIGPILDTEYSEVGQEWALEVQ